MRHNLPVPVGKYTENTNLLSLILLITNTSNYLPVRYRYRNQVLSRESVWLWDMTLCESNLKRVRFSRATATVRQSP